MWHHSWCKKRILCEIVYQQTHFARGFHDLALTESMCLVTCCPRHGRVLLVYLALRNTYVRRRSPLEMPFLRKISTIWIINHLVTSRQLPTTWREKAVMVLNINEINSAVGGVACRCSSNYSICCVYFYHLLHFNENCAGEYMMNMIFFWYILSLTIFWHLFELVLDYIQRTRVVSELRPFWYVYSFSEPINCWSSLLATQGQKSESCKQLQMSIAEHSHRLHR